MNTITGHYFDTVNSITADCGDELLHACMQLCARYEQLWSKTLCNSDVWRLNHACGQPIRVDPETLPLLNSSLQMHKASKGAFNIAVGALMELWDFRQTTPHLPDPVQIQAALKKCDLTRIRLDGNMVCIPGDMRIDLGGIAKGYIADRVGDYLKAQGVESALLNFGGNIVAIGPKPDGSPWKIGLQTPGGVWGQDYWAVTELSTGTIVTSGVHERCFELDGKRYHHILDPRTGWPAESGLVSVVIRGKDSMLADAIATAALVMGASAGAELAAFLGCQAILIDGEGEFVRTADFPLCDTHCV